MEDVPLNKRTKSMAMSLAEKMGSFVEFDESDPIGWSKFMRVRVDVRLDKPLRRGAYIATSNGSKWVKFKYEKLMDICYACGKLGHNYQQCIKYDDVTPVAELPYGMWMRGSPTRRRRTVDFRKEEEIKLCQEFQGSLRASKVKAKLNFDKNSEGLGFEDRNKANKGVVTVYDNPIAGEEVARGIGSSETGMGLMGSDARLLKRGRNDIGSSKKTQFVENAPIFDTPMYETSVAPHNTSFPRMDGSAVNATFTESSAAIGEDQCRRSQ